eukprot:760845-Hanusia_phi.AAC.3
MRSLPILREVPVPHIGLWSEVDLSRGQKIQNDDLFGSAISLGPERILSWRVSSCEGRQCLQLLEFSTEVELQNSMLKIYFPEPIVCVKCFFEPDVYDLVIAVVTLTGVRIAWLKNCITLEGSTEAAVSRLINKNSNPLSTKTYESKEGQQVLCCDARLVCNDLEIYLGTNVGLTLNLVVTDSGNVRVKNEFKQNSTGFSLFRSPSKSSGLASRICCVRAVGQSEVLLTLSEDGKIKRWHSSSGKQDGEKIVKLEIDEDGQKLSFQAFDFVVLCEKEKVVFALRSEDSEQRCEILCCNLDRVVEFKPERSRMIEALRFVQKNICIFQDSTACNLEGISVGRVQDQEVLFTTWSGQDATVTCATFFDGSEWSTEKIYTQSLEIQSQLALANMCMTKWQSCNSLSTPLKEQIQNPARMIEDIVLHPRRFSGHVLLLALRQTNEKFNSISQPSLAWPKSTDSESGIHFFVKKSLEETAMIAQNSGFELEDVWHTFLENCVQTWKVECQLCAGFGVINARYLHGPDFFCNTVLVRKDTFCLIRIADGSEHDFSRVVAEAEEMLPSAGGESDDYEITGIEDSLLSNVADSDIGCLWLGYKMLLWAEESDPGGAIFTNQMLQKKVDLALEDSLHLLLANSGPSISSCDPAEILGHFPEILKLGGSASHSSKLSISFENQLESLKSFAEGKSVPSPEGREGLFSRWMQSVLEQSCEQIVTTNHEVVRSIALLLALLDYHCKATGCHESLEISNLLHEKVLPLLVEYHVLRWCSSPGGSPLYKSFLHFSIDYSQFISDTCERIDGEWSLLSYIASPSSNLLLQSMYRTVFGSAFDGDFTTGRETTWNDIKTFCKMPNMLHHRSREWTQSISCIQSISHDCFAEWRNFRKHPFNMFWEANSDLILQDSMAIELYDLRGTLSGFVTTESMKEIKDLLELFFCFHDKNFGIFEFLIDTSQKIRHTAASSHAKYADASDSSDSISDYICRLIGYSMEHVKRIEDIIVEYVQLPDLSRENYVVLVAFLYLLQCTYDRRRIMLLDILLANGKMDEAYCLISDRLVDCQDRDIARLEEIDSNLQQDEVADVSAWFKMRAIDLNLHETILSRAEDRRQQTGYRCLHTFITGPNSELFMVRKRMDKLCCYPWVGCGHTVDTLLRQQGSQADVDALYFARYSYNIARSDYRAAGETMLIYLYNSIEANARHGNFTTVEDLKKQQNTCLAAINAYNLIDEKFAYWIPPSQWNKKRTIFPQGGMHEWEVTKITKLPNGTNQGWEVNQVNGGEVSESQGPVDGKEDEECIDDNWRFPSGCISLQVLKKFYVLLRCRIKLADLKNERSQRIVHIFPSRQDSMAKESAMELIENGLLEDAITLSEHFGLDNMELCQKLAEWSDRFLQALLVRRSGLTILTPTRADCCGCFCDMTDWMRQLIWCELSTPLWYAKCRSFQGHRMSGNFEFVCKL